MAGCPLWVSGQFILGDHVELKMGFGLLVAVIDADAFEEAS